ncbi:hypothetical protein [Pontibacter oryzae]|uniref:Uncharacterized protein n=1 Tax=Pontibacter oryzae TaxID=2304593 RepID=A0A399SL67_9BACT|nr:hypothetical protein [Pontibacter oryzae]RIJ42982.1 hypothetical protein D1627_03865 [Pontibacter oryzae]
MYVNLFPGKQLRATKRSITLMGSFLFLGGGYALMREFLWFDGFRSGWALVSGLLGALGLLFIAFGTDFFRFKDAFFSMTPERIAYRLSLLGREHKIRWHDVQELVISDALIRFKLRCGKRVNMRIGAIQQPDIARHVSRSIHLAALEKGLPINGVKPSPPEPALQV